MLDKDFFSSMKITFVVSDFLTKILESLNQVNL